MLIFGVWQSSGSDKYIRNTSIWPFNHQFSSMNEIQGYEWLNTLPDKTTVFALCDPIIKPTAYNKQFNWNEESVKAWKDDSYQNQTTEELHEFFKRNNFEYVVVGYPCIRHYGVNETQVMVQGMLQQPDKFQLAVQRQGLPVIIKIN